MLYWNLGLPPTPLPVPLKESSAGSKSRASAMKVLITLSTALMFSGFTVPAGCFTDTLRSQARAAWRILLCKPWQHVGNSVAQPLSADSAEERDGKHARSHQDQTRLPRFLRCAGAGAAVKSRLGRIKLIDFGSACAEFHMMHTYIQSRFYRWAQSAPASIAGTASRY